MCMMHFMMGHSRYDEPHSYPRQDEDPLDILKRRFARGEITQEQFEEMRRVLNSVDKVPAHAGHASHQPV